MTDQGTRPLEQADVEEALAPLLNSPLHDWNRAADMATIGFGAEVEADFRKKGHPGEYERRMVSQYALHLQCNWRVVREGRIIIGSEDVYYPPAGIAEEDFDRRNAELTRRDELVDAFIGHRAEPHVVVSVDSFSTGDFRLGFDDGCALATFIGRAQDRANDREHWRFFVTGAARHFVVRAAGVDL